MPWGRSPRSASLYQGWEKEQSEWSVTKAQLLLLAAGLPAPRTVCGSWESPEVLLVDVGVKPPSLREVEWSAQGRPASKQVVGRVNVRLQIHEPFCGPPLLGVTWEQENVSGPSSTSSPLSQATATACSSWQEPSFAQPRHPEGIPAEACSKQAFHGYAWRRTRTLPGELASTHATCSPHC